ncbi:hypothetical protein AAFF_G00316230 [Aldrovandia affinis]|uniref:Peptidase A2 domain-containing protein n=1 Tax=Aldrovandia affinis TaxID=143900 RepID=A0AAD7WQU7_9TELE|nr:hypothetical protein AAFF_G00316230 [Aldrovandia affinis]
MDNHNTVFKIDTGADVTAVPEALYTQGQFSTLERATLVLKGPGRVPLKVKGKFIATLSKRNKTTKEDVYVMEALSTPLLSRPAATALQLVARLEDVGLDSKETIKQEFPKLFSGLGKMEGEYNIVLKLGAKPFSLSKPRRISHSYQKSKMSCIVWSSKELSQKWRSPQSGVRPWWWCLRVQAGG